MLSNVFYLVLVHERGRPCPELFFSLVKHQNYNTNVQQRQTDHLRLACGKAVIRHLLYCALVLLLISWHLSLDRKSKGTTNNMTNRVR